mmetsp:Transcript_77428/g.227062  ORF Transcript_77428/g.227062 Transcript_77428/m.227062 type:complete len:310 (+) Transcript_77428:824-1753(+)
MRSRGQKSKYSRGRSCRTVSVGELSPAARSVLRQASHFSIVSMRRSSWRSMQASTSAAVVGMRSAISGLELRTTARAMVAKTPTPSSSGCARMARTYCVTRSGCQRSSSSPKRTQISSPRCEPQRCRSSSSAARSAAQRCWNCVCLRDCSNAILAFFMPQSAVNSAMASRAACASCGRGECQLTATTRSASVKLSSCALIDAKAKRSRSRRCSLAMCAAMSAKMMTLEGTDCLSSGVAWLSSAISCCCGNSGCWLHSSAMSWSGCCERRAVSIALITEAGKLSSLSRRIFSPDRRLTQPVSGPPPFTSL